MLLRNLFFLYSLTVVAIASTILSLFNYNPFEAKTYQFIFFYLSLLISLTGIIAITLFYLKIFLNKKEIVYQYFWPSVRQSLILSFGLVFILALRGMKLLDLWVTIPLFITIILLELFFRTKK